MTLQDEIDAKVDSLFASHQADRPESLKIFFEQIRENYKAATTQISKHIIAVGIVWFAAMLIHAGIVDEVEVLNLKVKKIGPLLLIVGPMLGALSHQIMTKAAQSIALWAAIKRSYKHTLPKAHELRIAHFAVPTSFLDDARFLTGSGILRIAWVATLVCGVALMTHIAVLLNCRPTAGTWELWSSLAGLGLWLHGFLMYFGAVVVSEVQTSGAGSASIVGKNVCAQNECGDNFQQSIFPNW